jgi:predicted RNA-binding protein with PUA-like domain
MAYWLLKTEPSSYSFADLERDGRTVWDGVRNAQALIHLRAMHTGDRVLIYHSGDERAVVGSGTIESEPYPDPQAGDPKLVVVDVCCDARAAQPVSLTTIKADPSFADLALVRHSRLSVMPMTDEHWRLLSELAGLEPAP